MEKKRLNLPPAEWCKVGMPTGVKYLVSSKYGREQRHYYITYRTPDRKQHNEFVGAQYRDKMTPAKAAAIRFDRMRGKELPNEAKREAKRIEKEAEAGRWTLNRLWSEWKAHNQDKRGLYRDETRYNKHLKDYYGDKEPRQLVPLDMERLRSRLVKEKYATDTIASVLSLLRRIVNYSIDRQLCPPLSFKIKLPKGRAERTETLTDEQMATYIKVCKEWDDRQVGNFSLLILHTGLRRGEVMNLKWQDVHLEQGFLRIVKPKGGKDAAIPLSDAAIELLRNHPRTEGSEFVFTLTLRQVVYGSRAIRDAAGLPKSFRPSHGLRHSFASALASSGEVTIQQLMALLTHKSPQMTMRYSHMADSAMKRSANVMGRIIGTAEANGKDGG